MPCSMQVNLGKLLFRYPKANLRGIAVSQLEISTPDGVQKEIRHFDRSCLESSWLSRGQNLKLELIVSIDGEFLRETEVKKLCELLLRAKMWSQLGLWTAAVSGTSQSSSTGTSSCVVLDLKYVRDSGNQQQPTIYDICYRIPPSDIAPPKGIDAARVDVIKLNLAITRHQQKKGSTKRRKTDINMLDDSGEDELLLTPPDETVTESSAMLVIVDAVLRKYISISTRVSLLPTIAHAMSQSLYLRARSPTLRRKMLDLFSASQDESGRLVNNELEPSRVAPPSQYRFELLSMKLWTILQTQTRKDRRMPKICPLGVDTNDSDRVDDEDLFASQLTESQTTDSETCEIDMYAETWRDEDDLGNNDLVYENAFGFESEELSSTPRFSLDAAMLEDEDDDDDLLLDLMLDERCCDNF
ncbi:uncharacterized protein PV09_03709 [Verruconis gallopava]|uniref:Uncharacterized protein n=1 Tax=Verruconis gallopava TaxID=253628 RepID=A0A0D2ADT6_9PEZI|nr:uncharacterized protein PV09_03709 [Verruconis gallopava]KIW05158.1 hypothetical protein PV09_03709 [Verruconis gallopava]